MVSGQLPQLTTCMGCGQNKVCHILEYGKPVSSNSVVRITEQNSRLVYQNRITSSLCDDCIGKTGKVKYSWIWWVLGISLLLVAFSIYNIIEMASSPDMPAGIPLVLLGAILGAIGATSGLMKLWSGTRGKYMAAVWVGMFLGWSHIPTIILLVCNKKLRRNVWVEKCLKENAELVFGSEVRKAEDAGKRVAELAGRDINTLTDEEKKLVADKLEQDRRTNAVIEAHTESERRRRYSGAVIGIIFTIFLAIVGLINYDDGGYMQWFGIKLSLGGFLLLIGAFIVYDIIALVAASKKKQGTITQDDKQGFNR